MARKAGKLIRWNDEAGYGFIGSPDAPGGVFVHIKDFRRAGRRPLVGDTIFYADGVGRDGRPAAADAEIAGQAFRLPPGPPKAEPAAPLHLVVRVVCAAILVTAILIIVVGGYAPLWFGALYAAMGLLSLALYGTDKARSETPGAWRIREKTLHTVDLFFGICGGLLAQGVFRHKSSKASFYGTTMMIVMLHVALLGAIVVGYVPLPG